MTDHKNIHELRRLLADAGYGSSILVPDVPSDSLPPQEEPQHQGFYYIEGQYNQSLFLRDFPGRWWMIMSNANTLLVDWDFVSKCLTSPSGGGVLTQVNGMTVQAPPVRTRITNNPPTDGRKDTL